MAREPPPRRWWRCSNVGDSSTFSLCLTHDVDRPYKTYHGVYEGLRERSLSALATALPGRNPFWQFDDLVGLERRLGVRSAFYFLDEPSLFERDVRTWFSPQNWIEHLGRYDPTAPDVAEVIRQLESGGWEVGLHGSRDAARDRDRLADELARLESVLEGRVRGGRHHHLTLERPWTWRQHASLGLDYDATLGSTTDSGFNWGYQPFYPFDDEFVVFPLTLMESTLPSPDRNFEEAWEICENLLQEAAENEAVMSVLWHLRVFNEDEFPGYGRLYRRLIERALEMDAWVGSPAEFLDRPSSRPSPAGRADVPSR